MTLDTPPDSTPLGRGAWALLDQATSSLTNFGLSFVALRSVGLAEFGGFTIAFAVYSVCLAVSRALIGEPLVVRYSVPPHKGANEHVRAATGAALLVGCAASIALALVALAGRKSPVGSALGALALVLPGLLVQDAWRFVFFSRGKPVRALSNDLVWAGALLALFVPVLLRGTPAVWLLVLAWGTAGTVAAAFGIIQTRLLPSPALAKSWLIRHRDLGPRFVFEALLQGGSGQLANVLIGAISGLAVLGSLNGARVLLGPMNVLYVGAVAVAVPEGARLRARSPARFQRFVYALALGLTACAALVGAVLLLLPGTVGQRLIASNWTEVRPLIAPVTWWVAGAGGIYAGRVGLRVLADARASLSAQATSSSLVLVGAVVGALVGDGQGAAIGIAIAATVSTVVWLALFRRSDSRLADDGSPRDG